MDGDATVTAEMGAATTAGGTPGTKGLMSKKLSGVSRAAMSALHLSRSPNVSPGSIFVCSQAGSHTEGLRVSRALKQSRYYCGDIGQLDGLWLPVLLYGGTTHLRLRRSSSS